MAVQKKGNLRRGSIKDKIEKDFISNPDTFADALNGLLYEGRNVIQSEALLLAPTETFYPAQDGIHNQYEDIAQYEMVNGKVRIMYLIANQSRPDCKMHFRKASYVGGAYREQNRRKLKEAYPVIQVILNWGKKKWPRKRRLKQLFKKENFTAEEWDYIEDQELLVFNMRYLSKEVRKRFRSDLRIVVDYFAEGKSALMTNQKVKHRQELVKMIDVLSGNGNTEELEKILQAIEHEKDSREEKEMRKNILEQLRDDGKAEATVNYVDNLIQNLSLTLEEACDSLGITVSNYEEAKTLLAKQWFD